MTAAAPLQQAPRFGARDAAALVAELRASFESGLTRDLSWRRGQLDALVRMLDERESAFNEALTEDLGKPRVESWSAEVGFVRSEATFAKKRLRAWTEPKKVPGALIVQPATARVRPVPLGVALIVGPWNYPVNLALAPLVGAIAAGCCVVIKPSEVAAATSRVLAELVPQYLDPRAVRVVEGAVHETTVLLEQRWDKIFYTGNGHVGRIVMAAAAKHLTPVTLELGGKSPTIVDRSANLRVAARRIAWAKFWNCGQTCVAPDYVLAHEAVYENLLEELKRQVRAMYGADPRASRDLGRVVNERHVRRLERLLEGAEVFVGGGVYPEDRFIEPTILRDVPPDHPVMADEIFGPILPVLKVPTTDAAVDFVNARPRPLALYVFAEHRDVAERVLERTISGGAVINHALLQLGTPTLPFGGVGESGMGSYHGRYGFEAFSHQRAELVRGTLVDPGVAYPPYSDLETSVLRTLI